MQNVVNDVNLHPTAAGSTWTDTEVLLCLDSGALERKFYTGCIQAHAASASSRAVVSHGQTCVPQPCVMLQRSAQTESDQGHAAGIQPGRRYSCQSCDMMNNVTSIDSASRDSERRMQRIWLRTLKHELTSRVRWVSIDMSLLRRTPRSRTLSTGATEMEPTISWSVGSWCRHLGGPVHYKMDTECFCWQTSAQSL